VCVKAEVTATCPSDMCWYRRP